MPETNINIQVDLAKLIGKVQQIVNANREDKKEQSENKKTEKEAEQGIIATPSSNFNAFPYAPSRIRLRRPAAYVQPLGGEVSNIYLGNSEIITADGAITVLLDDQPPPAPPSGIVIGPLGRPISTETLDTYVTRHAILPVAGNVGIFFFQSAWARATKALTGGPMGPTREPPDNPSFGYANRAYEFDDFIPPNCDGVNYGWSWVGGTIDAPDVPPSWETSTSAGSTTRCWVFNDTSIREIAVPASLNALTLDLVYSETALNGFAIFLVDSPPVEETASSLPVIYDDITTSCPYIVIPRPKYILDDPTIANPSPFALRAPFVSHNFANFYPTGITAFSPTVYDYLLNYESIFKDLTSEDLTVLRNIHITNGSIGAGDRWQRYIPGEPGEFKALFTTPTGTMETFDDLVPEESPLWANSPLKPGRNLVIFNQQGYDGKRPAYCRARLLQLGFTNEDLIV